VVTWAGSYFKSFVPPYLKRRNVTAEGVVTLNELKHRLIMVVWVVAIVIAMSGWTYTLGWVALKLIQYV